MAQVHLFSSLVAFPLHTPKSQLHTKSQFGPANPLGQAVMQHGFQSATIKQ